MVERNTSQKLKIIEHLKSVKTHPNAEMVYVAVKKELPTISLATVYRNLNSLAKQGKILKLEINNEARFDGDIKFHQHCVCNSCGKIVDLFQPNISKYALDKFDLNGFQPSNVDVVFHGTCKECM